MRYEKNELWKATLGGMGLGFLSLFLLRKPLINYLHDSVVKRIMTDSYSENLWEFISASTRAGLQPIVENNLRSQEGKIIYRPLGTPRKFLNSDDLLFNIAQLAKLPTPEDRTINMETIIGPQAARPLQITMPIMITGMAYGLGLSEKAKIALALGATKAGTAINSGEGPFLPSERKAAQHYILMYDRTGRNHNPAVLKQADAVEIQFGQGAIAGIGHPTPYASLPPKARKLMGLKPNQPTVTRARQPGISDPAKDLPLLVNRLRQITGGVPIGAKIGAGHSLEKDLEILVDAGIDFITVDGAEAATRGGPPILMDDFGVPTIIAVNRAGNYLQEQGLKNKITLIASGGLFTPGAFLKAVALGADAVYIGTAALFATVHTQSLKAMPFEPPTQTVFAQGNAAQKFNVSEGAQSLANFLNSCNLEMLEGIKALGKTSLQEVCKSDLRAVSPFLAKALDIPLITESIFAAEAQMEE